MYAYISTIIQRITPKTIRTKNANAELASGEESHDREENCTEVSEINMQPNDINVAQTTGGSWQVSERAQRLMNRTFKIKSHAIAFGRAQAFSSGSRLYLEGPDGTGVLQTEKSLTYPLTLE